MKKINLNLVSGAKSEKPLISAFAADNNKYIVLDNEINGSMGLPIILVSKFEGDKLVKIADQNEWQQVKEHLKNIIAGNKLEFLEVPNEITADDIFYTQLTLPVVSFDALKNAYPFNNIEETPVLNPIEQSIDNNVNVTPEVNVSPELNNQELNINNEMVNPVSEIPQVEINNVEVNAPEVQVEPTPVEPVAPVMPETPAVDLNSPVKPINEAPEVQAEPTPVEPVAPVMPETPAVDLNSPVINIEQQVAEQVQPEANENPVNLDNPLLNNLNIPTNDQPQQEEKEPEITPTPIIDSAYDVTHVEESMFKEQKEAFMQACENMFDALVQKFEKELENRK